MRSDLGRAEAGRGPRTRPSPLSSSSPAPRVPGAHGTGRGSSRTRRRPPWCTPGRKRPRRSRSTHSPRRRRRSRSLGRRLRRRAWGPPGEGRPCARVHAALPGPGPPLCPEKRRAPRLGQGKVTRHHPPGACQGGPTAVPTTPTPHCPEQTAVWARCALEGMGEPGDPATSLKVKTGPLVMCPDTQDGAQG